MKNTPDWIAHEWEEFSKGITDNTPAAVQDAIRMAFWSGCVAMHGALLHFLFEHSKQDFDLFVRSTTAELEAFSASLGDDDDEQDEIPN